VGPEVAAEIRFLGGLEVRVGDAVASLGGPQARAVLALLALDAPTTVPVPRLIDELWPEDPPRHAVGTIQTHVATLRRALGDDRGRLRTRAGGYALDLDGDEPDAARFEALARRGRRLLDLDPTSAVDRLQAALELWLGEPFLGLTGHAARLALEATRLRELHVTVREDLADGRLRIGDHAAALADLERLAAAEPPRERTLGLLLRALVADGRQTEAATRFDEHRRRLDRAFGATPSPMLQRLRDELQGARAVPTIRGPTERAEDRDRGERTPRPSTTRLPTYRTRLFGRAGDLDGLVALVSAERLVTVTGVAGCGKTRVATEVAHRVRHDWPSGVHVVDLAAVDNEALVAHATARALGVTFDPYGGPVHDQLVRSVADERHLVVLDDCEHLIDAVADHVDRLLSGCGGVTVLATSRERLCLDGERVWQLRPLDLPSPDAPDEAASWRLLVDRARAVRRDLDPDAHREGLVAICHRLDGLPLALELVAPHLAYRSAREVADDLAKHDRIRVQAGRRPTRHRSLDAAIDASYRRLPRDAQAIFRGLAPFVGGATIDAVTAVAGNVRDRDTVAEVLGSLVERSLVTVDTDGATSRYGLLETVRAFARQRLREAGEEPVARRAHRDHVLALVESLPWDERVFGSVAADVLETELGNLHAAVQAAAADDDHDVGVRLAAGAPALISLGGHWDAYDAWIAELSGVDPSTLDPWHHLRPEPPTPARLFANRAWLEAQRFRGDVDDVRRARRSLQAAAAVLPRSDPARILLEFLVVIGEEWTGDLGLESAEVRFRELAEGARAAEAPRLHMLVISNGLALTQLFAGRPDDAVATLRTQWPAGLVDGRTHLSAFLTVAHHLRGDHEAALTAAQQLGDGPSPVAPWLHQLLLALAVVGGGDLDTAHHLIGRARATLAEPRWHHPAAFYVTVVVLAACAVLEGRDIVAQRLFVAAGEPPTFWLETVLHRHYRDLAGAVAPAAPVTAEVEPPDLEAVIDAELVRWARPEVRELGPTASG
jgi:predicted ATPase/DNA-binding SARP family transcriptional activator